MKKQIINKSGNLSDDELIELKRKANIILSNARSELLYKMPFIGTVAMSLDIIPVRDTSLETAACDGKRIFFDIDFLSRLDEDETVFILAHEVWHAVMSHMLRYEGRILEIFNIAADMEVNSILSECGFKMIDGIILPETEPYKFKRGLSLEEYYELLLRKNKQKNNKDKNNASNSNSYGGVVIDQHYGCTDDKTNAVRYDKYGKVSSDSDYTPAVSADHLENMREIISSALQATEMYDKQRGNLPAFLLRELDKLLKPIMPWQDILNQYITRQLGAKSDWSKPNRRFSYSNVYMPSHYSSCIKIAVGIDTSGSTYAYVDKFINELNGILSSVESYELHLVECDTEIGKYEVYDDNNPLIIDTKNYKITGGGGTELHPIFDKLATEYTDIDCAVIFTDGYIENIPESMAPSYPVLWLIAGNDDDLQHAKEFINFGEVIHFTEEAV